MSTAPTAASIPGAKTSWNFASLHEYTAKSSEFRGVATRFQLTAAIGIPLLLAGAAVAFPWSAVLKADTLAQDATSLLITALDLVVTPLICFGFMYWSMRVAYRALSEMSFNEAIATFVSTEARRRSASIGPGSTVGIERLEEVLPALKEHQHPVTIRVVRRAIENAVKRRFESRSVLLEQCSEEMQAHFISIEETRRAALHMGILGTFIGLTLALGLVVRDAEKLGIGGKAPLISDAAEHRKQISDFVVLIISQMYLAFGTSIAGISVSLFASVYTRQMRARHDALLAKVDLALTEVDNLARKTDNRDDLIFELSQLKRSTEAVSERVQRQSHVIETNLANVVSIIGAQSETIKKGLTQLAGARAELDQVFQKTARTTVESLFKDLLQNLDAARRQLSAVEGVEETLNRFEKTGVVLSSSVLVRVFFGVGIATTIAGAAAVIWILCGSIAALVR